MATTEQGFESAEPLWTAAAVARRLGLGLTTLRSWILRYGIGFAAALELLSCEASMAE